MKCVPLKLVLMILLVPSLCHAYEEADCARCHGTGAAESTLVVSMDQFKASAHGREVGCMDCHTDITDAAHQGRSGAARVDCNQCHEQENRHGVGGLGGRRPRCHDCHSTHGILSRNHPDSTVHVSNLKDTCKGCHPVAGGDRDFLSWLPSIRVSSHGKQDLGASYDMGNCVGCHQGKAAHGEDQRISQDNCDKCHIPEIRGRASLSGTMHPKADPEEQPVVYGAALVYQGFLWALVACGIGFIIRSRSKAGKPRG